MTAKPTDLPATDYRVADRSLLRRFLLDDDAEAFAEIVQRHSGLVMSVCRRVVGQAADVDDAFQATFLAVAQRPRSLRRCHSLAGWLYCVAFRTSRRLVRQRNKKAMGELPEKGASIEQDPIDQIARASDMAAVDEELQALPLKYRDVLVMSYFSGQTSQQIADQLDVSKGAIDGRIRQARNALRVRLARRGVELGAIGIAASLVSSASAYASPALIQSTIALGQATLTSAAGAAPAAAHLNPLISQEITMLNMKTLLTTGLAGVLVVTALGLSQPYSAVGAGESTPSIVADSDDAASDDTPLPALLATVQETATTQPDREGAFGAESADGSTGFISVASAAPAASRPSQFMGFSSAAKRQAAARIREVMTGPAPEFSFPGEVPLSEVLQMLQDRIRFDEGFDFTIVPDRIELELDGISSLDDVVVTDLEFPEGITLHSAFEHILSQTSDPRLDYVIKDEVMLITTRTAAEEDAYMETRLYDVSTILPMFQTKVISKPAVSPGGGPGGGPGSGPGVGPGSLIQQIRPIQQLLEMIQDITSPTAMWFDIDGAGGRIGATETHLMIRQSRRGHEAVVDVLEQLHQTASATRN